MSKHVTPADFAEAAQVTDDIPFDPVPIRPRCDGWSAERQRLFIRTLAETGCVTEACACVRQSRTSAYKLRTRPGAEGFDRGWRRALDVAVRRAIAARQGRSGGERASTLFTSSTSRPGRAGR